MLLPRFEPFVTFSVMMVCTVVMFRGMEFREEMIDRIKLLLRSAMVLYMVVISEVDFLVSCTADARDTSRNARVASIMLCTSELN